MVPFHHRIREGEFGGRRTYSVDPQSEIEWGEPKEVILTPLNHTKVYWKATDYLRRQFPVLGGVQKICYQNLLVGIHKGSRSQWELGLYEFLYIFQSYGSVILMNIRINYKKHIISWLPRATFASLLPGLASKLKKQDSSCGMFSKLSWEIVTLS